MAKKPLPTAEQLRQLLRYDPETGKLFWFRRPASMFKAHSHEVTWNKRFADKEAFTSLTAEGYLQGTILGWRYNAHRVIWAMVHNEWPKSHLDHINGCRSDNRMVNLRMVSDQANARNQKRYSSNTSGVTGVQWHKAAAKWTANIRSDHGRNLYLGLFDDFNDAVSARKAAEVRLGYHPNHGR